MPASLNRLTLIGNLGRDPEVRYTPSGVAVTTLHVATTETWKDKTGGNKEHTEWHRVVFFSRLAEVAGEYLKKGSQIYVEGPTRTRKWTDDNGIDRFTTELRGEVMLMLGNTKRGSDDSEAPSGYQSRGPGDFDDDGIPH